MTQACTKRSINRHVRSGPLASVSAQPVDVCSWGRLRKGRTDFELPFKLISFGNKRAHRARQPPPAIHLQPRNPLPITRRQTRGTTSTIAWFTVGSRLEGIKHRFSSLRAPFRSLVCQRPFYATGRSKTLPDSRRFDARQYATVKPCGGILMVSQ